MDQITLYQTLLSRIFLFLSILRQYPQNTQSEWNKIRRKHKFSFDPTYTYWLNVCESAFFIDQELQTVNEYRLMEWFSTSPRQQIYKLLSAWHKIPSDPYHGNRRRAVLKSLEKGDWTYKHRIKSHREDLFNLQYLGIWGETSLSPLGRWYFSSQEEWFEEAQSLPNWKIIDGYLVVPVGERLDQLWLVDDLLQLTSCRFPHALVYQLSEHNLKEGVELSQLTALKTIIQERTGCSSETMEQTFSLTGGIHVQKGYLFQFDKPDVLARLSEKKASYRYVGKMLSERISFVGERNILFSKQRLEALGFFFDGEMPVDRREEIKAERQRAQAISFSADEWSYMLALIYAAEWLPYALAVPPGVCDKLEETLSAHQKKTALLIAGKILEEREPNRYKLPREEDFPTNLDQEIRTQLMDALLYKTEIQLTYKTGGNLEKQYQVLPILLEKRHGKVYCFCFDYSSGENRSFRLDRIQKAEAIN